MSAWKKLNRQDVSLTVHDAKKSWEISNGEFTEVGIRTFLASSGSTSRYLLDPNDIVENEYSPLLYRSIEQLYYRNFSSSGSLFTSSSYDYFFESYKTTESRFLDSNAFIISLPRDITGNNIVPGTLSIVAEVDGYVEAGYYVEDYVKEESIYKDDREGRLIRDASTYTSLIGGPTGSVLGNVIYSHGLIIFTHPETAIVLNEETFLSLTFKSNIPVYTLSYNLKLSEDEFNFTYNPSSQISGSMSIHEGSSYYSPSGLIKNSLKNSDFIPYITSVGLYNDANELIAIGKLGQPLPKSKLTETTIKIQLDT